MNPTIDFHAFAPELVLTGAIVVVLVGSGHVAYGLGIERQARRWFDGEVSTLIPLAIRQGDTLSVRLPSGDERPGTVFYRRVDAVFATQRDVSRTKRDIKTFEIRLRVDNKDRHLAVGMTTYVELPLS